MWESEEGRRAGPVLHAPFGRRHGRRPPTEGQGLTPRTGSRAPVGVSVPAVSAPCPGGDVSGESHKRDGPGSVPLLRLYWMKGRPLNDRTTGEGHLLYVSGSTSCRRGRSWAGPPGTRFVHPGDGVPKAHTAHHTLSGDEEDSTSLTPTRLRRDGDPVGTVRTDVGATVPRQDLLDSVRTPVSSPNEDPRLRNLVPWPASKTRTLTTRPGRTGSS